MAKKLSIQRPTTKNEINTATQPSISAEAALSFLKDTKGAVTWSVSDLAATLKISRADAQQVVALLAAQGLRPTCAQRRMDDNTGRRVGLRRKASAILARECRSGC